MKCKRCRKKMNLVLVTQTRVALRIQFECSRCGYTDFEFEDIKTGIFHTPDDGMPNSVKNWIFEELPVKSAKLDFKVE